MELVDCRLPTIQKTETLLLGSYNNLVVLNDEKLVSLGTNHFWYGPDNKYASTIEVCRRDMSHICPRARTIFIGAIHYFEIKQILVSKEIRNKGQK